MNVPEPKMINDNMKIQYKNVFKKQFELKLF